MKTMFKSQELWDMVENGYTEPAEAPAEPDQRLRENRKIDAKALFLIQSALDDEIFPRISVASTSKQTWEIIKQEYFGDKKVLRSLNSDYKHIVTAILEFKDISTYKFNELMSSLMAHEERMDKSTDENVEEKFFQVTGQMSGDWYYGEGRGRGIGSRGCGRDGDGRGRGRFEGQRQSMSSVQCYYCKRYGHKEDRCWDKQRDEKDKEQTNFVKNVKGEEINLF
ncbi:uncharacterized protein [Spinacia oleracea]|uniref:CCHC-type domain-containing protein n=1 Tax=Spinacia oleracea TaxID=3562 RepID=A0ABM3QXG6_SPIOL|nr:uncharacterized protein LOC130463043 [Spinacia oleracea]